MILNGMSIEGHSIAGESTQIRLPDWEILLDIGVCLPESIPFGMLLITHGHPDHIGGLALYLFGRKFTNRNEPLIIAPESLIPSLKQISNLFSSIHGSHYPARYTSIPSNSKKKLSKNLFVSAIPSTHSIPSNCYSFFENKKDKNPVLSYTGDTSIDILDQNPFLYNSGILIIESTYLGPSSLLKNAKKHQHVHLEQIYERSDLFQNDYILLTHISRRFSFNQIRHEFKRCPKSLKRRLLLL